MLFDSLRIGFAMTGSYCTLAKLIPEVERLVSEGASVLPILSESVVNCDTRFGKAQEWKERLQRITSRECIASIVDAEPIGPKKLLDVLVIAPCTGNTLGKLANGITDTSVTMAAKAHLRNMRPVVIAVSTNDALGANAKNIGILLNTKNIYFVPMRQDDPVAKSTSIVAVMDKIIPTIREALAGRQIEPVFI
ncbi:MAG TPA: dipicolinate synthase subunit B [Clostridia bacterium]|nr:dipicolinate synthase subunit B [Clostridia bacterium]